MIRPLRSIVSITATSIALLVVAHYSYGQGELLPAHAPSSSPDWHQIAMVHVPDVAPSYLVFDVESGEVLFAHAATTARPIASLTKLISAAVVWRDVATLPTNLSIATADTILPGTSGAVLTGEQYTPHELLFPLILTSSNHAAAALERTDAELVTRMNQLSDQLGLATAKFIDASGLSDGNVASAQDMQQVLTYLHREAPHILDISRLEEYLGSTRGWRNNNPLSADGAYYGGKHGYTPAAGRTAAALFTEDFTAGPRLLGYVVLGATDSSAAVTSLRTHITETMNWQ